MIVCENLQDAWFNGSRRQGFLLTNDFELTDAFGPPGVFLNDCYEWALRFVREDGVIVCATIYPSQKPGSYEIGGYDQNAVVEVMSYLGRINSFKNEVA